MLLARILFGLLSITALFLSINYLPLADALLLFNTAPLFVPLVVMIALKIKTQRQVIYGILVGFVGIVFAIKPNPAIFNPAAFIAIFAAVCMAIGSVLVRQLSKRNPTSSILFYYFIVCTVTSGVVMMFQWRTPNLLTWLWFLGVGVAGTSLQIYWTYALRYIPARIMTPLTYIAVIFAAIFDWFVWHMIPSIMTTIGLLVVLTGVIITVMAGKKHIV